jgi:hypothetical protein
MSIFQSIRLDETEHGWVATDTRRNISSAPCATRDEALDDLDENIAIADGELTLSDGTEDALDETESEYDRGETVALDDLR